MARENPWRTLRERPELVLVFEVLPDGTDAMWDGNEVVLDARLDRVQRRCALMHELVHHERQVGWPDATAQTMEREEAMVRKTAALRLVPADELEAFIETAGEYEPVTAQVVSREFDVTTAVAREAMWALVHRRGVA